MAPSGFSPERAEAGAGTARAAVRTSPRERRANQRYTIELEFDLFYLWGASHLIWAGEGRTRNWSRNSILIQWNKPLTVGGSVELVVRWSRGVQLIVVGKVLSSEPRGAVVRIVRRRFRGRPELAGGETDNPSAPLPEIPGHMRAS